MDSLMPKVSVIIPCYNAEKYIDQCITSVLQQTMQDIEVFCIDDGSTDNTLAVLRRYEAKDTRLKVLCQQNEFAGVARNRGTAASSGEYIAFLDADDYYEPDGLEKAYGLARENNLDMLKLSSWLLDDATSEISTTSWYSHTWFPKKNMVINFRNTGTDLLKCADVPWNGLYRRAFLQKYGIQFNNFRCVNDHSFYIWCLIYAERIMVADQYLTCYRRNIAGSLVSVRSQYFQCQIDSYNLVKQIITKSGISEKNKKTILYLELEHIFNWYHKFVASGIDVYPIENIIRDFIKNYDEQDISVDHLQKAAWKQEYIRFKRSLDIQWQHELSDLPEISVIIPVNNRAIYLSESIESVLLQTFRNFEVICVNDGSTGQSESLLRSYAQRDGRIRILNQTHAAVSVAKNHAIREARGTYLCFLDSDDALKKEFLQELYDAAVKHRADVAESPQVKWFWNGREDLQLNPIARTQIPQNRAFAARRVPDYILSFSDEGPGGKLFRREFVLQHNLQFLTISGSEDFYFVQNAFLLADRICQHPVGGYLYRQNSLGLEDQKEEKPLQFWNATLMFKEHLKELGLMEQYRKAYLNNTIRRLYTNLKSTNHFERFSAVFYLVKEIQFTELRLDIYDEEFYFEKEAYQFITDLMHFDTPAHFLYAEYGKLDDAKNTVDRELAMARQENIDLRSSASFRIGRLFTWFPRKIRGFVRHINKMLF